MRRSLETVIIMSFLCFLTKVSAQEDPTVPISQRYLNNSLFNDFARNPIPYDNPFIQSQGSQKNINKNLKPNETLTPQIKIEPEPKAHPVEEAQKSEQPQEKKEEKKTEPAAVTREESRPGADDGLFGSFRIGPMVGFGILIGPQISIESKLLDYIGLSFSYSGYNYINLFLIPGLKKLVNSDSNDYNVNTLQMKSNQFEGKFSIYPFSGSFFIGVAYGKRNITLNANGQINATLMGAAISTPVNELVSINSIYYTPQIGWLTTWGGKYGWFAIGSEFGLQFSIKNTVSVTTTFTDPAVAPFGPILENTPEYIAFKNNIQNTIVKYLNEYPLPYWNILKIGWIF